MDAAHPIFRGPLPVELDYEQVDTPDNYRKYRDGQALGDKVRIWRVHDAVDKPRQVQRGAPEGRTPARQPARSLAGESSSRVLSGSVERSEAGPSYD